MDPVNGPTPWKVVSDTTKRAEGEVNFYLTHGYKVLAYEFRDVAGQVFLNVVMVHESTERGRVATLPPNYPGVRH